MGTTGRIEVAEGWDRGRKYTVYVVRRAARQWCIAHLCETWGDGDKWAISARHGTGRYMHGRLSYVLAEDVERFQSRRAALAAAGV